MLMAYFRAGSLHNQTSLRDCLICPKASSLLVSRAIFVR